MSLAEMIRGRAAEAFARHEIEVLHHCGLYRQWRCGTPERSAYAFWVTTMPGYAILTGDLGATMLARERDMLPWLAKAVRDPEYMAGKVVTGIETHEFDEDGARQWVRDRAAEEPGGRVGQNAGRLLAALESGEDDFRRMLAYDCGVGIQPRLRRLNGAFLWHCECFRWFVGRVKE